TIQQLFEEQVERTPDNIGIVGSRQSTQSTPSISSTQAPPLQKSSGTLLPTTYRLQPTTSTIQLTYRELNEKSNRMARTLQSKGVGHGAGTIVAIKVEPSIEMAIGLLGILKAGGAYLPIDPQYPQERIDYMLKDSNVKMLLKEFREFKELNELHELKESSDLEELEGIEVIDIHTIYQPFSSTSPQHPPFPNNQSPITNPLAYIIYTSGTTGKPKGVAVNHESLVNYINWRLDTYRYSPKDVTLQLLSYSFDGFASNFYSGILSGGKTVIISKETLPDYRGIVGIIKKRHVTNTSLVPAMYRLLLDNSEAKQLDSLRFVVLAGEASSAALVERSKTSYPGIKLNNEYGPTEATVTSVANTSLSEKGTTVIGRPINNINIYILSKYLKLQPVGVPGELCISGAGLARGYLNNQELTAERFANYKLQATNYKQTANNKIQIKNKKQKENEPEKGKPIRTKANCPANKSLWESRSPTGEFIRPVRDGLYYRTGDLARWLVDGKIEFLGRIDHQVKIRGFRIELGEIENSLLSHPAIKEAVVIARQSRDGDNFLCAYYVEYIQESDPGPQSSSGTQHPSGIQHPESGIRKYLSQSLPDYMIPAFFIKLENLPLTPNGKIDSKALSHYQISNIQSQTYTAPRNEIEKTLTRIWVDILDIDKQEPGIDDDFFRMGGHSLKATIMAARIHKELNVKLLLAEIFKNSTIRTLADSIKELTQDKYLAVQPAEKKEYYIMSAAQKRLYVLQQMDLESTVYNMPQTIPLAKDTDLARLENAFKKLIRLHESLRTSFHMITPFTSLPP
ncbi:MAG: amino acid adenylation domain-containing protein, partial [bacterium]|nr:amino acid adenylation domain-containing protein [bacterium]